MAKPARHFIMLAAALTGASHLAKLKLATLRTQYRYRERLRADNGWNVRESWTDNTGLLDLIGR